jgi:FkbM family methyltransferase
MRFWPRKQSPIDRDDPDAFLAFVRHNVRTSYSQRFQDLFGLWESGFAPTGYFVEFGAMAGVAFSNSYVMEQLGWSGVVSEPNPVFGKKLHRRRSCYVSTKCVFDTTGSTVRFHAVQDRQALSTVEGFGTDDARADLREDFETVEVETITLNDLLDEAGAPALIDFLSIDTEGSEPVILRAFDFDRHPIRAISVEHNDHQRDELYELLTSKGYRRKWPEISGHDDWYVRTDLELGDRDPAARDRMAKKIRELPPFEAGFETRVKLLASLRG